MDTPTKLSKFVAFVLSKEGLPYCWPTMMNNYSGKGWEKAKYKDCYDCSGLMTDGIRHATDGKLDYRLTVNCVQLRKLCRPVEPKDVVEGDFAFYGHGLGGETHVMMVLQRQGDVLPVFGASGGNHYTTSPELARKQRARVRSRSTHLYRRDFLGFYRLEALHG